MTTESIRIIFVKREVDSRQNLCVLLAQDGLVNRLGTGAVNSSERNFFIGHTNEPLFTQLRDKLQPEWVAYRRTYDIPNKRGRARSRSSFRMPKDRSTASAFAMARGRKVRRSISVSS